VAETLPLFPLAHTVLKRETTMLRRLGALPSSTGQLQVTQSLS